MNVKKIFAENLKRLREAKKLNQGEFAERVGVDQSFISKVEREKHFPDPDTIDVMAKALGVPAHLLFTGATSTQVISEGSAEPLSERYIQSLEVRNTKLEQQNDELFKRNMEFGTELLVSLRALNKTNQ